MTKGNVVFDTGKLKKNSTLIDIRSNKTLAEGDSTPQLIKQAYGKKGNNRGQEAPKTTE